MRRNESERGSTLLVVMALLLALAFAGGAMVLTAGGDLKSAGESRREPRCHRRRHDAQVQLPRFRPRSGRGRRRAGRDARALEADPKLDPYLPSLGLTLGLRDDGTYLANVAPASPACVSLPFAALP